MTPELTVAGYVVIAVAAVCLEVAARRSSRVAPFAEALGAALRWWPLRALLWAGWLWLGWHVFVRVHWR